MARPVFGVFSLFKYILIDFSLVRDLLYSYKLKKGCSIFVFAAAHILG